MMTVKELVEELQKYPEEAEVYGFDRFEHNPDARYLIISEIRQDDHSLCNLKNPNVNDILIDMVVL